jgi:hypothetical protein
VDDPFRLKAVLRTPYADRWLLPEGAVAATNHVPAERESTQSTARVPHSFRNFPCPEFLLVAIGVTRKKLV